jgi:hypothetical protein
MKAKIPPPPAIKPSKAPDRKAVASMDTSFGGTVAACADHV